MRVRRADQSGAPNPRDKVVFQPASRRRTFWPVVVAFLVGVGIGGASIHVLATQSPDVMAQNTDRAQEQAFVSCGNGRWVSDPSRCD